MTRPGIKPLTFQSQGRQSNHNDAGVGPTCSRRCLIDVLLFCLFQGSQGRPGIRGDPVSIPQQYLFDLFILYLAIMCVVLWSQIFDVFSVAG